MPLIQLTPLFGRYLSFTEREEIALLRAEQVPVREIARQLARAPSTISRKLRRNAATRRATRRRAPVRRPQSQRPMRPPTVVMGGVQGKHPAQMALVEYQHPGR